MFLSKSQAEVVWSKDTDQTHLFADDQAYLQVLVLYTVNAWVHRQWQSGSVKTEEKVGSLNGCEQDNDWLFV